MDNPGGPSPLPQLLVTEDTQDPATGAASSVSVFRTVGTPRPVDTQLTQQHLQEGDTVDVDVDADADADTRRLMPTPREPPGLDLGPRGPPALVTMDVDVPMPVPSTWTFRTAHAGRLGVRFNPGWPTGWVDATRVWVPVHSEWRPLAMVLHGSPVASFDAATCAFTPRRVFVHTPRGTLAALEPSPAEVSYVCFWNSGGVCDRAPPEGPPPLLQVEPGGPTVPGGVLATVPEAWAPWVHNAVAREAWRPPGGRLSVGRPPVAPRAPPPTPAASKRSRGAACATACVDALVCSAELCCACCSTTGSSAEWCCDNVCTWTVCVIENRDVRAACVAAASVLACLCWGLNMGFSPKPAMVLVAPAMYAPLLVTACLFGTPLPFKTLLEARGATVPGTGPDCLLWVYLMLNVVGVFLFTVLFRTTLGVLDPGGAALFFTGHAFAWTAVVLWQAHDMALAGSGLEY